jgi:hypothetical protein
MVDTVLPKSRVSVPNKELAKALILFGGVKFPSLFFGRSGARIPGSAAVVGPARGHR